MISITGKTYWLIGASEGLGRELAKQLCSKGANVVLSARNTERLDSLCAELPTARSLPLDVTDGIAVQNAAQEIGHCDGVIYNAGVYEPMTALNWDKKAVESMCDVNFMGAMRVLGEVVPRFVNKGVGDITLVGSLAGYRGLPGSIGYGASKAALVSLAETMRSDLKSSGVTVRIVNPGFIDTRLTQKNNFSMPMLMQPEDAAEKIVKAMQSRRFRTDFPRPFSWLICTLSILPDFLINGRK